jgi:hypothetical protein
MGVIMKTTNIAFLHGFKVSWHKMLLRGLLALAALNPPAFLLAQNSARGIKFERLGLEQGLSQNKRVVLTFITKMLNILQGQI